MKTRRLDFLVIGAHKSGTTTLFQYLRYHPQIFLPPEKEIAFFSNESWYAKGWDKFAEEFFSQASADALWGKVTPQYMAYSQVPERIRKEMPDVKLIALLRNPVDRAFSHYRMAVRTNSEKRAFREVISRCRTEDEPTGYFALGEYGRILNSFRRYFPLDRLLILFTDDLELRPQFVLDSIARYLGLDESYTPKNMGARYHVGATRQRFPWLVPTVKRVYPLWRLWKLVPERRRRVIRFWFHTQFNSVSQPSVELNPSLRLHLIERYREDIETLEALMGRKVPWKEFHPLAGQ
jgi:Sulfotransferase domain